MRLDREKIRQQFSAIALSVISLAGFIVYALSFLGDWQYRGSAIIVGLIVGAIEIWTLIDGVQANTLSETIWRVARRPTVGVWAGSLFTFFVMATQPPVGVVALLSYLMGHFFWQSQFIYDSLGTKAMTQDAAASQQSMGEVVRDAVDRAEKP